MVRFQSSTHFKLIWLLFGAKIPKIHHLFDPYKLIDSNAASIYKIGQEHAQLQEANKTSWRQVRPSVTHLCNNRERYRKSSRSPATRRVYISVFRVPQWHGATETHFPPRPRKSAWYYDITNVIRHTVCPHTRSNIIRFSLRILEITISKQTFFVLIRQILPDRDIFHIQQKIFTMHPVFTLQPYHHQSSKNDTNISNNTIKRNN